MFCIDSQRFDEAYKILDSSFPSDELKTYPRLLSDFIFGGMKIFALGDDKTLSAVLTLWEFENFVFVENFAVKKELRNSGLGSKLIENLISHYSPKPVVLEVEVPETEIQEKRVNFYKSKGFNLSDTVYTQPPLRDEPSDIRLCLMYTGDNTNPSSLLSFKNQVFKRVYGLKDTD